MHSNKRINNFSNKTKASLKKRTNCVNPTKKIGLVTHQMKDKVRQRSLSSPTQLLLCQKLESMTIFDLKHIKISY